MYKELPSLKQFSKGFLCFVFIFSLFLAKPVTQYFYLIILRDFFILILEKQKNFIDVYSRYRMI